MPKIIAGVIQFVVTALWMGELLHWPDFFTLLATAGVYGAFLAVFIGAKEGGRPGIANAVIGIGALVIAVTDLDLITDGPHHRAQQPVAALSPLAVPAHPAPVSQTVATPAQQRQAICQAACTIESQKEPSSTRFIYVDRCVAACTEG